jgi:hypothetical protein
MKHILPLILVAGLVVLGDCKEKKQSTDIITTKYVPKQPQDPIAMPAHTQTKNIEWQGKPYTITIDRVPVDSLPQVKDENNQPYVDNRVKLTIMRADGSAFFQRTSTKASFNTYIDDSFRKNGILAGFRYDEVENSGIEFSVVVALPDAIDDVFVPLELVVDRQGGVSITRDDDMDMLDYDERNDEEVENVDENDD